MATMPEQSLQVLFHREEESWNAFGKRIAETAGEVIVVLSAGDDALASNQDLREQFLSEVAKHRSRVRIAVRHPALVSAARRKSMRVLDRTRLLRQALGKHPAASEAIGLFSPHLWRQHWRSRLQSMGLLTLPKLRIWTLIVLSFALFLFVFFKLLPSAEIRIWPRGDSTSQTANIFLVQSGAVAVPSHVRMVPLIPIITTVRKAITFDQISKQFIGKSAEVSMMIVNKTADDLSLREGTRLENQAGMVFKTSRRATVPANGSASVPAKAADLDVYDEIIGERGNVPAGLKWTLPALTVDDQKLIYGENRTAAQGGRTAYRTILQQKDLDIAKKRLEQELQAEASDREKQTVLQMNQAEPGRELRALTNDQLVKSTFTGFVLPTQLLNQPVTSVPVEGALVYTVFAYDAQSILQSVSADLESHVAEGKKILPDTVNLSHLDVRVFDYADDLSWIKATVEMVATEQFILDPLSPDGAKFAKKMRDDVVGLSTKDALRIIRNLPEVEKVEIKMWPPWSQQLPDIPSHISMTIH